MMMRVADSDTRRRVSAAPIATLFAKLVLSGPPQRSPSLPLIVPPGPPTPLPEPPPCCTCRQPVLSPGKLPRRSLLRRYLVNTSPSDSTSSQRLPWLSGVPNSNGRVAVTPTPAAVMRCAYRLSYEVGTTSRAVPDSLIFERGSLQRFFAA